MVNTPVYMDYLATTPVDRRVVEAMLPFLTEHFGNPASLQHRFGWIAREAVESARKKIADALNARPVEIVFTSSATEANNLALKGIAEAYASKGNHIITTQIEHKCVLESCRTLERKGFHVTYLPVDRTGMVNVGDVRSAITKKTILVSVMSANNEIGTLQPITEIGALCAERNLFFHTDATQGVGKIPMDVQRQNIHLLSFASHKLYGPKGVGALYVRKANPRIAITAQQDGAGHEHGLRSGTLNVAGIVGFGRAVQLAMEEYPREQPRLTGMRNRLEQGLRAIGGVTVNGHETERLPNALSVTFKGMDANRLMTEMNDIAVSAGAACTSEETGDTQYSHVLRAVGLHSEEARSTIRFGMGRMTTEDEIDFIIERISSVRNAVHEHSAIGAL